MRRRGCAAALLLTLLVTGCSTAASEEADRREPRSTATTVAPDAPDAPLVAVLGDSNIDLGRAEIEAALSEAGFTPELHGISGSGLKDLDTDWLPRAKSIAAHPPDVVVVAIGTNDAASSEDTQAFAARLDVLLDALGAVPIVWVTHTEVSGSRPVEDARAVNDAIRAASAARPNVSVLDLASTLADQHALLGSDGLHYSVPVGRVWFADQLATAARSTVAA